MIRAIQWIVKLAVFAVVAGLAALVYFNPVGDAWSMIISRVPDLDPEYAWVRQAIGIAAAAAVLIALLPMFPKRARNREISFEGNHGEVTIDLDPVEATLERVVGKLPEVKTISIRLKPDVPGKVLVNAVGILYKDANSDARQVTARVNSFIQSHTRKILGLQDVSVKLKVTRWVMNMKSVKPEPLLLEAPHVESVPASQPSQAAAAKQPATQAAAAVAAAATAPPAAESAPEPVATASQTEPVFAPPQEPEHKVPEHQEPAHDDHAHKEDTHWHMSAVDDVPVHDEGSATDDEHSFLSTYESPNEDGSGEDSEEQDRAGEDPRGVPEATIDWTGEDSSGDDPETAEEEKKSSRGW